jgi:hypothetical protein
MDVAAQRGGELARYLGERVTAYHEASGEGIHNRSVVQDGHRLREGLLAEDLYIPDVALMHTVIVGARADGPAEAEEEEGGKSDDAELHACCHYTPYLRRVNQLLGVGPPATLDLSHVHRGEMVCL